MWGVQWVVVALVCSPVVRAVETDSRLPPRTQPYAGGDWPVADASTLGLDAARLDTGIDRIGQQEGVYGILVVRGGALVAERYFREGSRTKGHNLKSSSKSIVSALIGILIAEDKLSLNDSVVKRLDVRGLDDDRDSITVRDLLRMASGLTSTSYEAYSAWIASSDWVKSALRLPLLDEPGTRYSYSTGNTHLLSALVREASGMSTRSFAEQRLFDPLGIEIHGWETDPRGVHIGGNNLALVPRDMARFGELFLRGGRWNGENGDQLVPESWVRESTSALIDSDHEVYGDYGYQWFVPNSDELKGDFVAVGFGGQYIYVSPRHDTVVVITSTLESKGRAWERQLFEILREDLLQAAPVRVTSNLAPSSSGVNQEPSPQGSAATAVVQAEADELKLRLQASAASATRLQAEVGALTRELSQQSRMAHEQATSLTEQRAENERLRAAVSEHQALVASGAAAETAWNAERERLKRQLDTEQARADQALREIQKARGDQQEVAEESVRRSEALKASENRAARAEQALNARSRRLSAIQDDVAALRAETKHLRGTNASQESELRAARRAASVSTDRVATLERQLNDSAASVQAAGSNQAALQGRIEALSVETASLRRALAEAEALNAQLAERSELFESEVTTQNTATQRLIGDLEQRIRMLDVAALESARNTERLKRDLTESQDQLEGALESAARDHTADTQRATDLERDLVESERQVAEVNEQASRSEDEVQRLKRRLSEAVSALERLRGAVEASTATDTTSQGLERDLAVSQSRLQETETELSALRADRTRLVAGNDQTTAEIERLTEALAAAHAASEAVRAEHAVAEQSRRELGSQLRMGEARLKQLAEENQQQELDLQALSVEVGALRAGAEAGSTVAEVKPKSTERDALLERLQRREESIRLLRAELEEGQKAAFSAELTGLQKSYAALVSESQMLAQRSGAQAERIASLERRLRSSGTSDRDTSPKTVGSEQRIRSLLAEVDRLLNDRRLGEIVRRDLGKLRAGLVALGKGL